MTGIIIVDTHGKDAPEVEEADSDPAALIYGPAKTRTWNFGTWEDGRLVSGIWESTEGSVRCDYSEWEFCHFISGKVILTADSGESWTLTAGDAFIIPPGFKGTWETIEPVRKHYVILLPKG